jgi:L-lysine exporter family protein LysE/ArgO
MDARAFYTLASGLLFGLSLIVAIGPQNAFVVRQGALREHVGTVVVICAASDVALIAAGVAGAGAALSGRPWLLETARLIGATVLLLYAALAARRALARPGNAGDAPRAHSTRTAAVAACLAFTWLNPAVYLDTVVLLGSVAHTQTPHQWWFGAGAALGSLLWFTALAAGARRMHPVLTRPHAWRSLDGFVALVMAGTALRILVAG